MLPYRLTTHPFVRALRRPWKMLQGAVAAFVFGFPSRRLRVVGVTGTTGKTTTIHLIAVALESAGYTVGAVSSIHVKVGTKEEKNRSGLTSLGPWQLQRLLAHMVRSGCHYAIIECSSHALDQRRFFSVDFDVAAITNIERDHFDYHGAFADYARAKRRLFEAVSRRRPKTIAGKRVPRVLVAPLRGETRSLLELPADAKWGIVLDDAPAPAGISRVQARDAALLPGKTHAVVDAEGRHALLHLPLPGMYNVENALLAVAVGVSQGIEVARITRELSEVESVPGRFERVEAGQPFQVIVDYAVTALALRSLYEALRAMGPKRIFAVFGAAGNRDRGKRAEMAEIVGRNADVVFLTNEDPFTEDPEQIFSDLEVGLKNAGLSKQETVKNKQADTLASSQQLAANRIYVEIPDRREAIRAAVSAAQPGDIVVATGKGAEETMRFKDKTIPWSDRRVFEEELHTRTLQ
jgi:UDP-N-acetylmuramoyl-L-alanyl-D-glutamate--2,6-diaminopimelate ligase